MTKSKEDKAHDELLALYDAVQNNIDNFKKDNRTYLLYYSAIVAGILTFHKDFHEFFKNNGAILLLIFLSIGAWACRILIWYNYKRGIQNRRRRLGRIVGEFLEPFWQCNFDDFSEWYTPHNDLQNKKIIFDKATNRGPIDGFIHDLELAYPLLVFFVTGCLLGYEELSLTLIAIILLVDLLCLVSEWPSQI